MLRVSPNERVAEMRTRAIMLLGSGLLRPKEVNPDDYNVGSWDTATSCVYSGPIMSMVVDGLPIQLRPGNIIDEPTMFAQVKALGLEAIPLANGVVSEAIDAEVNSLAHKPRGRKPKHSVTPEADSGIIRSEQGGYSPAP